MTNQDINCQSKEIPVSSLSDALTAYTICAKAERKSPETISWVRDAVRYFSDFLGDDNRALSYYI